MFLHFASLKNVHNKPYFRCFVTLKNSHQKISSVSSIRPIFFSKNTIERYVNNFKYLQCLLKKSKINDFEILRRSLSTSSCSYNERGNPDDFKNPKNRNITSFLIPTLLGLFLLYVFNSKSSENFSDPYISWEEFKNEMLAKGEVKKIVVHLNYKVVMIELHEGAVIKNKKSPYRFYIMQVPEITKFEDKLREVEAKLGIAPQDSLPVQYYSKGFFSNLFSVVIGILMLTFVGGLLLYFMNSKFGKNIKPEFWGFTKAKFTLVDPLAGEGKGVKFSDVAGLKEAKTEILDFVDYLKRPDIYRSLGAKVPKGALLLGPPGCGKTLLAKAVATEANVPFLSMNGSEFIEIIGGLGAARVRDLFKEAKRRSPCIIYIDEIDAIGKKRESHNSNWGVGEVEQTLNQLLVEMDGVVSNEGVVLLASTNRADVLDAALLRPGRFDRQILIDLPTFEERQQIFEQHLKGIHLELKPTAYSKRMAHLTPGFSGADIANVCNEAALHAARLQKKVVQGEDLEYAVERVVGGTEKRTSALSPEEKRLLAYYEAGRALTGWLSKYGEALLKITIVSRTDSPAGWTHFSPNEKFLYSTDDLRGKMCMGLGGRVALTLLFNRVTTAGEKDLKKVTRLAYAQIRKFGMNEKVGLMSFDINESGNSLKKPYSKALAALFDQEARKLVAETYKECEKILIENKDKLIRLAEELLVRETLNYDDVVKLIGPPSFKEKKFVEPTEFILSLDQAAAGSEPTNFDRSD